MAEWGLRGRGTEDQLPSPSTLVLQPPAAGWRPSGLSASRPPLDTLSPSPLGGWSWTGTAHRPAVKCPCAAGVLGTSSCQSWTLRVTVG